MEKMIIAAVVGVISILASVGVCFSEPVLVRHDQPIPIILEGRRVISVSGDSFVYNLGHETIVITANDPECRHFLANVRGGHRDMRIRLMLIPERKSAFNERYQSHLLIHHPSDPAL
jgi:hypothetical protein